MSVHALAFAALYLGFSNLHGTHGASIAKGKYAKQSSTISGHDAHFPLDIAYRWIGALTSVSESPWWEVDLRGYFTINNITITTLSHPEGLGPFIANASVEVMDKDVSLCSDAQVVLCGTVPSTIAHGDKFTFTCNATFPVRFVRVTRRLMTMRLRIGHVDVQGEGTMKPCRLYYKPSKNKKVSQPFLVTSAVTASDCGIICHRHHACINFSYSATAPTDDNCLLTDKVLTSNHVYDNSWSTYTIDCM